MCNVLNHSFWGRGLDIGAIYALDNDLYEEGLGSYSVPMRAFIRKYDYVLAYEPAGDCCTRCLLIKRTKKHFKGMDINKHSFLFYRYGKNIVKQCSEKEMYKLLSGDKIDGNI